MYLYSMLLFLDKMFKMGKGDKLEIFASSSKISGM